MIIKLSAVALTLFINFSVPNVFTHIVNGHTPKRCGQQVSTPCTVISIQEASNVRHLINHKEANDVAEILILIDIPV
jgi:hypothetical protein